MLILSKEDSLQYIFSGLFEAPSSEWVHMSRELPEYELMLVMEGTLYIASESEAFEVPAGHYLLMPPTAHQYGTKPGFCKFYWFHFHYPKYETGFSLPLSGVCGDLSRLLPFIHTLWDAEKTYHNPSLNGSLFRSLLFALYLQQPAAHEENKDQRHKLCENIKNYIEWNYFSNIKVAEAASYFGYHEKYISTLFKQETGTGLKEYILKVKMEHACRQLSATDISISRLALNLGFPDAHNFSSAFRKVVGVSPSTYRKSQS